MALLPIIALTQWIGFARAATVPPTIDLNGADVEGTGYSATFTEDEGAEPIVSTVGLFINNGTDTELLATKATLTNLPDGAAESLAADKGSTSLTVQYSAATGELTVTGKGSVAEYEQVLRTLTYNNTSQSPDNVTDRIVLITVSDGALTSQPATSTVAINAVNDAPVLDNSGNMILAAINEDDQSSSGNSVTGIIKSAEQQGQDRITDVDKNALEGFAVIEAGSTNGVWQYSVNAGSTWQPFGAVSNTWPFFLTSSRVSGLFPMPILAGRPIFNFEPGIDPAACPVGLPGSTFRATAVSRLSASIPGL